MTCSRDDDPTEHDKPRPKPMKTLIGIAIAMVALFAAAGTVAAHEATVDVDCDEGTITAHGVLFGESLPITVTLTAADEFNPYFAEFEVTTDEWTHAFQLGPNGGYQLDWPNSGDFGPVEFSVQCAEVTPRPTPSVSGSPPPSHTVTSPPPSLHPRPTPPQTSTADAADVMADGTSGAIVFVAAVGLLLILHGLLTAGAKALGIRLPEDER